MVVLRKHVINDNGGGAIASDFLLQLFLNGVADGFAYGDENGLRLPLPASVPYNIVEFNPSASYTVSYTAGCSGTALLGETKSCTVTNDDNAVTMRRLTVTTAGSGGGVVASTPPGIFCGTVCTFDYADGTVVDLTPTADSASTFVVWSGACTGTGACSVTMNGAKTVGATFDTRIAQVILSANPASIGADGASTSSITARAVDALGAPVVATSAIVISLTSSNIACCVLTGATTTIPAGASDSSSARGTVRSTTTPGSSSISGTASGGYTGTVTAVTVTAEPLALIVLPPNILVAPGASVDFVINLTSPAPSGGAIINLATLDGSIATVSPSALSVAAGTSSATATAHGVTNGATTLSATSTSYRSDSTVVTVKVIAIGFTPPGGISVNATRSETRQVLLTDAAPPGGIVVSLVIADTTFATVTPSTVVVPAGQLSSPAFTVDGLQQGR
ncbi:MAG TPA: hypothetical protein VKJ07_09990, partial [Mycobacteriales bacterium]|nr:hypothetical protein [Mycobacteriales bacterium]